MKPLIGIVPLWDQAKDSLWMIPGYMDVIYKSGGIPIILPLDVSEREDCEQLFGQCDGFLLTGGQDVAPEIYGEQSVAECSESCPARDKLERVIFDYAVSRDIPTLGICRGIQFINAIQGGSLYQDIPTQRPNSVSHQMSAPYHRVWHHVDIIAHSPLGKLLGTTRLGVNSYHHQAINRLGRDLEIMAVAEDGVIEAVYMPHKRFIWALQWHPELNFHHCDSSLQIVREFITQASH